MSRTDLVHTRLARHNWVLAEKSGEKYLYRRGDHWIQLDPDGFGYHGYQDRRVSNGTHEQIVATYGETPDPRSANARLARVNALIGRIEVGRPNFTTHGSYLDQQFDETLAVLREYAENLFDKARHE